MTSHPRIVRRRLAFMLSLSVLFVLVACNVNGGVQDTRVKHQLLLDENEDGLKNASDAPLVGVTVRLLDAERNELATASSDASGFVRFDAIPAGSRLVIEASDKMRDSGNDLICQSFNGYSLCTLGTVSQTLDIVNLANLTAQAIAGGTFQVLNDNSNLCLHVPYGSTDDGIRLQQQTCFDNYTPQQWQLETVGSLYRLVNVNSSKVLGITGSSTANRAFAEQNSFVDTANQKWELRERDSGYELVASHSGKCLEVAYKNTSTGENLWQNTCDGSTAQLFKFALINAPDPDPDTLPDPDPNLQCGPFVQEAENGKLYGEFQVASQASASGGQFVRTPDGDQAPFLKDSMTQPSIANRLEYCFNVTQEGTYALETFVAGNDDSDDSFWVRFDTEEPFQYLFGDITNQTPNPYPNFTQDFARDRQGNDPVEVSLSPGKHYVTFFMRESDTRLDKLELRLRSAVNPDPTPTCAGLVQEAENGAFSGNFVIKNSAAASGGQYIETPEGTGFESSAPNGNIAAYCFNVPTTDTYYLKGTLLGADSSDDSFFVSVDDQANPYLWDFQRGTSFTGDFLATRGGADPVVLSLSAGEHIVKFYQREDGAQLDKLELVSTTAPNPDPPAVPAGFTATASSSSAINLSWNAVTNATSYILERRPDGGSYSQIASPIGTSYSDSGLNPNTNYTYRLRAVNASGQSSTVTASARTLIAVGNGTGLLGEYYDTIDFTGSRQLRTDPNLNFDWGNGSPIAGVANDTFSVRWTGELEAQFDETYTFYTTSDDGVRLWINNELILSNWTVHPPTVNTATFTLEAGKRYDIRLDMYENQGGAVLRLEWSSASQARQVIPQSQLYPASAAFAVEAVAGKWSNVQAWPLIATHMSNLADGRVLAWSSYDVDRFGGQPNANYTQGVIFDPASNSFVEADNPTHDMFCAGLAMLPDGRLFAGGGGDGQNSRQKVSIFDGANWSRLTDMQDGHWYGTAVAMPNGEVFMSMGANSGLRSEILRNGAWQALPGVNVLTASDLNEDRADWYAYFHLTPRGTIFHSGGTSTMHEIDVSGNGSQSNEGQRPGQSYRRWGSTIMIDEGKIMMTGGTKSTGADTPSLNTAYMFDVNSSNPVITRLADMTYSRSHHTSVILPNGEVLALGGNGRGQEFSDNESRLIPEIYNVETNNWREMAAMSVPRNYHSTATLLQDGRVVIAGGGLCGNCAANHQDGQIYSPAYLFNADGSLAARPSIIASPNTIGYNQNFDVTLSGAGAQDIKSFSMIKLSANTHAMNTDLRRVAVSFQKLNGSSYRLTSHANNNVLSPGNYYLFAINDKGVPSVAKVIKVN